MNSLLFLQYLLIIFEFHCLFDLKKFVLCFTDENTYVKLSNHQDIIDLETYGQQDINVYLEETIKAKEVGVNVDEVLSSIDDIFHYICYGRNKEMKYYTVEEY